MKRFGSIYEKIYDMENLREAHRNARKDKSFYKEVQAVDSNEEELLSRIQRMLKNKSYRVSKYKHSTICDKGKTRELMKLPYFPDRIIQWAIMLQVEEIFVKSFCSHTCASIKNRGIHRAARLVRRYMKDEEEARYCLKLDVKKFYPSINHSILKILLRRKFKDRDLLELLDKIIDSMPDGVGVPIGSYLSQFLANYYLCRFDHWLKEEKGVRRVVRYMDDIVIFHHSKEYLHALRKEISSYLSENLNLKLKENWQIFPVRARGVDFVGYRHFFGFRLLRKKTCKRFKRKMMKIKKKVEGGGKIGFADWCSANSYQGWLKWCDSHRLRTKYIGPIQEHLDRYYRKIIKRSG